MAPERRAELIQWARRRDALIVEDDYDAEYRYDREPVAALQGLDPDHVVYAGTASKMLAPGLRLAWLVLPFRLVDDVTAQQQDQGDPAVVDQAALASMIERGDLDRHCARCGAATARAATRSWRALRAPARGPRGRRGRRPAPVAWLPDAADESAIAARARDRGWPSTRSTATAPRWPWCRRPCCSATRRSRRTA